MTVNEVLPVILYILGSVLLVTLIIITMNKIDKMVDNITVKVKTLDQLFEVVGTVTEKFSLIPNVIIDGISLLMEKIFKKKGDKLNEQ